MNNFVSEIKFKKSMKAIDYIRVEYSIRTSEKTIYFRGSCFMKLSVPKINVSFN